MTVSIVIPCFNAASFVGDAVASASAQNWHDVEIIVVDDGSTDGSGATAACCDGVRVLRQSNRGLAHARNAGLAAARGEIVIFLDADDRLLPTAAPSAVHTLSEHPDAAMTFGRCQVIDESGAPLPTPWPTYSLDYYAEFLLQNLVWTPAMAAFRRSAVESVGAFDPSVNPSADYDLYLRVARQFPVVAHDVVVAEYRQHPRSMSRDPVLMLTTTLAVLQRHRVSARADPRLAAIWAEGARRWRWFYGERLVEQLRASLRERRYSRALKDAALLLKLYPEGVWNHSLRALRHRSAPVFALDDVSATAPMDPRGSRRSREE